ncbi:lipid asymmetry maintenance protein MlaB [Paraferrimonas sp. SM1919]|uniref:STAS domain-containing protein n=1 Tax=Paraferrimonas sp. SM1919 TaxID=2662263 RepID=UPI0013D42369|nr:STAS domain-containing protein [Paraferrimonas sp. SM1919]
MTQIIKLHGDIDINNVANRQDITDIPDSDCCLDLSDVSRIDSAGLAYLIECRQNLQQQGVNMSFRGASEALLKLAKLYDLTDIFISSKG